MKYPPKSFSVTPVWKGLMYPLGSVLKISRRCQKQDSSKERGARDFYSESLHVFPNAKETSPFVPLRLAALFITELMGKAECITWRSLNT